MFLAARLKHVRCLVWRVAISVPRVSRNGYPLPSARLVSAVIHWDFDIPHHMHTLMLMQVGQFVDHDLTRTAISKLAVNARGT